MALKLIRESNKYEITEFISDHNHMLQLPQACHLLRCQRKVTTVAATDIDLADDSGIRPKVTHELMGRQAGGVQNVGHTRIDQKNYLRDKRKETLAHGEAVSILRYFSQQAIDNPSFQHAEQTDDKQEISNIFWADAQMVVDYAQFGDVIIFDTTHGTNKEFRPFGVFVGLNQFREIVIFGAVLLYEQTTESFEWVFQTFLKAHNNKQPKTIFTDQDAAMGVAIKNVMPNVTHGLCTWHIMENVKKHLSTYNNGDIDYVAKFRACVYNYEEEAEFEKEFGDLESKLGLPWFPFILKDKKKWAYCYMKNAFSLGVRSTQLSESLNKDLKNYLKANMDIVRFFRQFERVVADKREKEVKAEFDCREKQPRVKLNVPILNQMSKLYTPKIFDIFQSEYELCMAAQAEGPIENCYIVRMCDIGEVDSSIKCCRVFWDPIDEAVSCSCKKFERWGVLCSHALKVLDMMNIKLLPEKYVLLRWTHNARTCMVRDRNGIIVVDPKLDATRRNRDLCRKFVQIAAKASPFEELSSLLDGILDQADKLIDVKKQTLPANTFENVGSSTSLPPDLEKMLTENPLKLKKKMGDKRTRRTHSWVEKLSKAGKKKNSTTCKETQADKGKKKSTTSKKRLLNQVTSTSQNLTSFAKESDLLHSTPNSCQGMHVLGLSEEHMKGEHHTSFTSLLMNIANKENDDPYLNNIYED